MLQELQYLKRLKFQFEQELKQFYNFANSKRKTTSLPFSLFFENTAVTSDLFFKLRILCYLIPNLIFCPTLNGSSLLYNLQPAYVAMSRRNPWLCNQIPCGSLIPNETLTLSLETFIYGWCPLWFLFIKKLANRMQAITQESLNCRLFLSFLKM